MSPPLTLDLHDPVATPSGRYWTCHGDAALFHAIDGGGPVTDVGETLSVGDIVVLRDVSGVRRPRLFRAGRRERAMVWLERLHDH